MIFANAASIGKPRPALVMTRIISFSTALEPSCCYCASFSVHWRRCGYERVVKTLTYFSITADKLQIPGDFPGTYGALKVSQLASDPDLNPAVNQRVRCAEEPWVNASGTTWPVA